MARRIDDLAKKHYSFWNADDWDFYNKVHAEFLEAEESALRAEQAMMRAAYVSEGLLTLDLAYTFRRSVLAMGEKVISRQLKVLAEVLESASTDYERRTRIHERIGQLAQDAVVDSYATLVEAAEGPASQTHYRAGANRLAAGVLRRALLNPRNVFLADAYGLKFVNVEGLDREAAHWHRVAFGAAPRGGSGNDVRFAIKFGNLASSAIGFSEEPSPAFRMPKGIFIDPETNKGIEANASRRGMDTFYPNAAKYKLRGKPGVRWVPHKQRQRKLGWVDGSVITEGIVGKNFFAAGVESIAYNMPRAYEQYYRDLYNESRRKAGTSLRDLRTQFARPSRAVWEASVRRVV